MPGSPNLPLPEVLSEFALSNSFLGRVVEVCLVTEDHKRTMNGLVRLGIGPFRVYTFHAGNTVDRTYRGQPEDFSLKVCFATNDDLTFEIMQPLAGRTVVRDFWTGTARACITSPSTAVVRRGISG